MQGSWRRVAGFGIYFGGRTDKMDSNLGVNNGTVLLRDYS